MPVPTVPCEGKDVYLANEVWNKNFSKGKLSKAISKMEQELGFDKELLVFFNEWRGSVFKEYSTNTHSMYISTMIGAYSFSCSDNTLHSGLLGQTSKASQGVLKDLNALLFYLCTFIIPLLQKKHNFKANINNEEWRLTLPLRENFIDIYLYYLAEDER